MKKTAISIIIVILLSATNFAFSQKSSVRFMIFTLGVENYCSFSFEQKINQKHAIGLQLRGNILYEFIFNYNPAYYINYGININYKYYLKNVELVSYFLLAEAGYLHLHSHYHNDELKSHNATLGGLFGVRKKFKQSKRWFMEASLGVIGMKRNYYYYNYIADDYPDPKPVTMPKDKIVVIPRFNVEVGFYL